MLSVVPAMLFWDSTPVIAVSLGLFALVYVGLYWRIVRFKSPRWMRALGSGWAAVGAAESTESVRRR